MKSGKWAFLHWMWIVLLLNACQSAPQRVEVTRVAPQTVVVTQEVPVTVTPTLTPILPTGTPTPKRMRPPTSTPTLEPTPTQIDYSQQDGSIAVTQYYTLLGLHEYEKAYYMWSHTGGDDPAHNPRKEKFISETSSFMKVVKVLQVVRYNDWLKQQNSYTSPPLRLSDDWYWVSIYSEGEDGGIPLGPTKGIHVFYVLVVKENGEWKLEQTADTPFR